MASLSKTCLFGLSLGVVGVLLGLVPWIQTAEENVGLGLLFQLRGTRPPPSNVVIVSIDRDSSERLNASEKPEQWPRSLHAQLVEKLAHAGAPVIVFDVYFADPRDPADDGTFAAALAKSQNVVLAERLRVRDLPVPDRSDPEASDHVLVKPRKPLDILAESAIATAPFVVPKLPVKVSRYWAFQELAGDAPTFPVVAFQLYSLPIYSDFVRALKAVGPEQTKRLPPDALAAIRSMGAARFMREIRQLFEMDPTLGPRMLNQISAADGKNTPAKERLLKALVKLYSGGNQRYLNFYGPPQTIETIPYYQVLQSWKDGHDLRGKAVFVGLSEKFVLDAADSFHTVFSQANGVFLSGVEIAATAFANLIEDRTIHPVSLTGQMLVLLIWGLIIGSVCRIASTTVAIIGVALISAGYLLGAEQQFGSADLWYPIVLPLFIQAPLGLIVGLLWNYFETNRERQNVRKVLRHYVPDEIVDQVARNKVDLKRSGRTEFGVCLFSDLADYTNMAERMDPRELSEFMQRYFEATFAPLKQNGGLVIDLEGDSILALWKGGRSQVQLRKQACFAALGLAAAAREFKEAVGRPNLATRIGVHAGEIYLGNIGTGDHFKYGPTGDTVNTASRMEGLNKFLGTRVLVSAEVIQNVNQFLVREAGTFRLKGKAHAITAYELICHLNACGSEERQACTTFADALLAFKQQQWDDAARRFGDVIATLGEDKLSRFYIQRCEAYAGRPPGMNWDAIIEMDEK